MPESSDDTRDDLTIPMLADQHVAPCSTIAYGDHELLCVPKREDDVPSLTIQLVHLFVALRLHPHRSPQPSNHRSPDRGKHRELHPLFDPLHGGVTHRKHPGTASHGAAGTAHRDEAVPRASPLRRSSLGPAP